MEASFSGPGGSDPVIASRRTVVSAFPTEGDGLYGMQRQRSRILKRTDAGVDANGAPFSPYVAPYAKRKAKYGRSAKVDLRGRNAPHMLQAMLVTSGSLTESGDSTALVEEMSIAFYDERAAKLAKVHNEGGTVPTRLGKGKGKPKKGGKSSFQMPRRHFFEATEEDLQAIHDDMGARVAARLQAQNNQ